MAPSPQTAMASDEAAPFRIACRIAWTATAIGSSSAFKILIPVNRCNHYIVGCGEAGLGEYIRLVCEKVDSMLQ